MTSTSKFFKTFHGGADGSPRQSGCAREELQTSPSPIATPVGRVSVDELQGDNQADELLIRGEFGSRCRFHPAIASLSPVNGFPRQPFYAALLRIGISLRSLDRARPTLRVSVRLEGLYTWSGLDRSNSGPHSGARHEMNCVPPLSPGMLARPIQGDKWLPYSWQTSSRL